MNPYQLNFEIKALTDEEYTAAPEAVRRVYISVLERIPLDTAEIKATIKAHPQYFTFKKKEVKKSFGQNVKRLFGLKNHLASQQKKLGRKPGTIQLSGTVTGESAKDGAEMLEKLRQEAIEAEAEENARRKPKRPKRF